MCPRETIDVTELKFFLEVDFSSATNLAVAAKLEALSSHVFVMSPYLRRPLFTRVILD